MNPAIIKGEDYKKFFFYKQYFILVHGPYD